MFYSRAGQESQNIQAEMGTVGRIRHGIGQPDVEEVGLCGTE